jgi:formylglycine-generating enzyme required for sulfatase activity/dienelactone hydrolase
VVSHEAIIDAVWAQQYVGEGVLRRAVASLREALGDDAKSPTYIETISKRGYRLIAPLGQKNVEGAPPDADAHPASPSEVSLRPQIRELARPRTLLAVLSVVALLAVVMGAWLHAQSRVRWAYETAIPDINRLIGENHFWAAFTLAEQAERYIPSDPTLADLWNGMSNSITVQTEPSGATVSFKPYDRVDDDWTLLGQTPLEKVRVPLGVFRWRLENTGYETRVVARRVFNPRLDARRSRNLGLPVEQTRDRRFVFTLDPQGSLPQGMVAVEGGPYNSVPLVGFAQGVPRSIPRFFIDQTEVTNRDYKEFLDAGGYRRPELWRENFVRDGRVVPFEEAMETLRDSTDQPGPAQWIVSDFPAEQADYPVGGVSWYEAAAYCEFRGKSLPTIYHWVRSGLLSSENMESMSPSIIPMSNFGGDGPSAVGSHQGIGASGAYDLAGNLREWCWNAAGENRYSLGGAWSDPAYNFTGSWHQSPWDRSPQNGFRCVTYIDGEPDDALSAPVATTAAPDYHAILPLPDEAFETLKTASYSYDRTPLNAAVDSTGRSPLAGREEWVSIDAAYGNERLIIRLHLPEHVEPPYQAVVHWGGSQMFSLRSITDDDPIRQHSLAPLIRSGRALVQPIFAGSYERNDGRTRERLQSPNTSRDLYSQCWKDVGRTLDYLEERPDINGDKIAYAGGSLGSFVAPWVLAFEGRLKAALLSGGGLPTPPQATPEAVRQAVDLTRRVSTPVLMINGRYDYLAPLETVQKPFFDLLATPAEHKRHVIFDTGHSSFPPSEVIREKLAWLDKYLGPVETR